MTAAFDIAPTRSWFFDRGDELDPATRPPVDRVGGDARVWSEWPEFCQDVGLSVPTTMNTRWTPRLVDWSRTSDGFEIFEVEMTGRLSDFGDLLGDVLLSCRHAATVTTMTVRPGVVRAVLNHTELPLALPFDAGLIPDSPDEFYLGSTGFGSDLIWDTRDKYHGLIVGESGSGKTEAAALVLLQAHLKGWKLIILTPTTDDPAFQLFADAGHTLIAGAEPSHLASARRAIESELADVPHREAVKAAAGDDWFQGQPVLLVVDESGDFLEDRKHDTTRVREDKAVIRSGVDLRARRGRKIRHHLLVLTQEPYAHNFGTPETLRQLSFRLAVTKLDRVFQPVIFQPAGDKLDSNVPRILSDPLTPKGRGIARGFKTGTGPSPITAAEIPVQVAWCPKEQRAALIGGRPSPAPTPIGLEVAA